MRNDLNVRAYIKDEVDQLLAGTTDYAVASDAWRAAHPESIREYRLEERRDPRPGGPQATSPGGPSSARPLIRPPGPQPRPSPPMVLVGAHIESFSSKYFKEDERCWMHYTPRSRIVYLPSRLHWRMCLSFQRRQLANSQFPSGPRQPHLSFPKFFGGALP